MRALAVALLILPACGARPMHYVPGGAVLVGDHVRYLVSTHVAGSNEDTLYDLECPADPTGSTLTCVSRRITFAEGRSAPAMPATGPRSEATAAAEMDHHCTATVQSGDVDTGFWLMVCGEQRFYRRESGTWVDRTP